MVRMAKAVLLVSILLLVGAQPALAYIDPNTGGMLFQMLAVAFASLSAVLLIFSRQIRQFVARVRRGFRGLSADQDEPDNMGEITTPDVASVHRASDADPEIHDD